MIHMSQFFCLGYSDFALTDQYTEINFHDSHESVARKLIGILFSDQYTEMNFHDLHVSCSAPADRILLTDWYTEINFYDLHVSFRFMV